MKTLFIIDAYNLIYRMFYAIPEMNTRTGQPVNAIFWVAKFLKSLADENPDASIIVANDVGRSFRSDIFTEYKWTRDRMPDNLRSQIDGVFALFAAAGILVLSEEWYEADDIIGSLAVQCAHDDHQLVIISSDKDLCQFVVDGRVHIYDAMKRKFMKRSDVTEKFGVPPEQVRDYLAIVGDSSDNIPGIAGFGPKKAVDLLTKYDTLEGIYRELWVMSHRLWVEMQLDQEKYSECELTEKTKQVLIDQMDQAFLSQRLASIVTDLILPELAMDSLGPKVTHADYIELLRSYEFRSLLPQDAPIRALDTSSIETRVIRTMTDLNWLIDTIRTHLGQVILSTWDDTVVVWYQGSIYTLSPREIDLRDAITELLSLDIELVWYDLKRDLKRLSAIKNPQEKNLEGQERLF
jgi:DNA polymerase I